MDERPPLPFVVRKRAGGYVGGVLLLLIGILLGAGGEWVWSTRGEGIVPVQVRQRAMTAAVTTVATTLGNTTQFVRQGRPLPNGNCQYTAAATASLPAPDGAATPVAVAIGERVVANDPANCRQLVQRVTSTIGVPAVSPGEHSASAGVNVQSSTTGSVTIAPPVCPTPRTGELSLTGPGVRCTAPPLVLFNATHVILQGEHAPDGSCVWPGVATSDPSVTINITAYDRTNCRELFDVGTRGAATP